MFKEIKSGLTKIFSKKFIPVIIFIIICLGLYVYSSNKYNVMDRMTTGETISPNPNPNSNIILPMPDSRTGNQYLMQPVANPGDLLPKDSNSQWASLNPVSQGNVAIPDLLQSGHHIGLDSIGQTLKNPNLQGIGRDDPVIERKPTGLWNQSTIEPDYARVV